MTNTRNDDDALDALFESAKTSTPVDDAFMARLMADASAAAAQNGHTPVPTSARHEKPFSFWTRWLPASGLTAATVAGFWMGMVLPSSDLGSAFLTNSGVSSAELADFVPTFGVSTLEEIGE